MGFRRSNMHMRKRGGAEAIFQYIRIVVTSVVGATWTGFQEIEYSDDGGATWFPTSNMTSNILPSPLVASASAVYTTFAAWKAYDGGTTNRWTANVNGGWSTIDLGSGNGRAPDRIRLTNNNTGGAGDSSPTEIKVYGSNTGAFSGEEVLLHTESGLGSLPDGTVSIYVF